MKPKILKKSIFKLTLALFCLLLSMISLVANTQLPVPSEDIYTFMKNNSVFRDQVEWSQADQAFASCLEKANTPVDTMNCFVDVLEALNDVHSHILFNDQFFGFYHPVEDSIYQRILPVKEKATAQAGIIFTTILQDQYVYICVPAISVSSKEEINRYGQALDDSICQYKDVPIKGFIIDLRLNTGGNMYPMLSGLSPLLGDNVIGYEMDPEGTPIRKWEIAQGNLFLEGYQVTQIKDHCGNNYINTPAAILLGPMTGSSGTMTAISFRHRPHTTFIGEPTADGYTTSNGYFEFAPNLIMNFATNFVADRKQIIYKTYVSPDITIIGGDRFDDLPADRKIIAAIQWLSQY